MNIPQEFEDVFRGVELTEEEIRTLAWIAGWESRTVENLRSAIQKARGFGEEDVTAISTLQAENEKLQSELEQVKSERAVALEHLHGICSACKNYSPYHNRGKCRSCAYEPARDKDAEANDNWEWRGQKED